MRCCDAFLLLQLVKNHKTNLLIWVTLYIHRYASICTEIEKIISIIHCKFSNKL